MDIFDVRMRLNLPVLSLGERDDFTPLHVVQAILYSDWIREQSGNQIGTLMGLPVGYRRELIGSVRAGEFPLVDPRLLPVDRRSDRWLELLSVLDNEVNCKCPLSLLRLLLALGFSAVVAELGASRGELGSEDGRVFVYFRRLALGIVNSQARSAHEDLVSVVHASPVQSTVGLLAALSGSYAESQLARNTDAAEYFFGLAVDRREAVEDELDAADRDRLNTRFISSHARVHGSRYPRREIEHLRNEIDRISATASEGPWLGYLALERQRRLWDHIADIARDLPDPDVLLEAATVGHSIDPWDAKANLLLGEAQYANGDRPTALKSFLRAALLGPIASGRSWYMAAMCADGDEEVARLALLASSALADHSSPDANEALMAASAALGIDFPYISATATKRSQGLRRDRGLDKRQLEEKRKHASG